MSDVNFVEYGTNASRLQESVGDVVSFGAENGYALGVVFGIFIAFIFILGLLAFFVRYGKKFHP